MIEALLFFKQASRFVDVLNRYCHSPRSEGLAIQLWPW
jgi:hypothetical protein